MSNAIKKYAVEVECMVGRSFENTSYPLKNGKEYTGIFLYDTEKEAQDSINSDLNDMRELAIENGEDPDDLDDERSVTTILISPDGSMTDNFGEDLVKTVALQHGVSQDAIKESLSGYYQQSTETASKHERDEGLGI